MYQGASIFLIIGKSTVGGTTTLTVDSGGPQYPTGSSDFYFKDLTNTTYTGGSTEANATTLVGNQCFQCNHYGIYIKGDQNALINNTVEWSADPADSDLAKGVYIQGDSNNWLTSRGNSIIACYFEHNKINIELGDNVYGTGIMNNYVVLWPTSLNQIWAVYNGYSGNADHGNTEFGSTIANADEDPITYVVHSGTISVSPNGTIPDNGYNGGLIVTKPIASGQYINLVRSGKYPWSIGMVHNTNKFAIGPGKATDSDFNNPYLVIQDETGNGNVGIGTTSPVGKLTVKGGTPDAGDLFNVDNADGHVIGRIYQDGSKNGVLHILDNSGSTVKIQLYSMGDSWFNGGNFGIGTTGPGSKLEVSGGDIKVTNAAKGIILTNAAGTITKRVRLNNAGNGLIFENS